MYFCVPQVTTMSVCRLMINKIIIAASVAFLVGCVTVDERKIDPERAVSSHVTAGMEYLRIGQPANARRHLIKAVEINDDSAEAHNALALLYRYEVDDEREEYHYRKALRADSDFAPARNNYGIFLVRKKRYDDALKQFSRAAENVNYDNRGIAYENMGRIYVMQDKTELAIDAYNKAMRMNPREVALNLELAELYYKAGDIKSADFYYSNYARTANPQPARALWLGIRIAAELKQQDRIASYELALEKLYPESAEYRAWKKWRGKS